MIVSDSRLIQVFYPLSKLLPFWMILLTISLKSYSQTPNKAETVAYINSIISPSAHIEVKHARLDVRYFNTAGELIREDHSQIADLELLPYYEKASGLLCLPCLKESDDCVTRILVEQGIKRDYNRVTLPLADIDKLQSLINAISHLIKLESLTGYHDNVVF